MATATVGSLCILLYSLPVAAQIKGDPLLKKQPAEIPLQKNSGRLSPALESLIGNRGNRSAVIDGGNGMRGLLQFQDDRHVLVDIITEDNAAGLMPALQRLGLSVTGISGRMVSGYAPTDSLGVIAKASFVHFIKPVYRPFGLAAGVCNTTTGDKPSASRGVVSQGDTAQGSWLARRKYNVDGKGIKLGILSDSYNSLGGASDGVVAGELPGPANPHGYTRPVEVLQDLPPGAGTDEGRALAEIAHDVAPGARLAFHTANAGEPNFAQGIIDLANAGCQVIADDILYYDEPFFSDGIIAQAINKVRDRGVAFFSAAGNQSNRSYESDYRSSADEVLGTGKGIAHNFSADPSLPRYFQPIFLPTGVTNVLSFQWDQSFFSAGGTGASTDMDIYLINSLGEIVAAGVSDNLVSGDPVEVIGYTNLTGDNVFFVVILKHAGADPVRLKYTLFNGGGFFVPDPPIPGLFAPTLAGHPKADGAITIAAAAWYNTPGYGVDTAIAESFGSLGGVADYFDKNGVRLSGRIPMKPDLTAPDGVNTSFFAPAGAGDIVQDADNLPNFFGTSAAAAHAAAVAALMLEAERLHNLSPAQLKGILGATTLDMDNTYTPGFDKGFDFQTGYGFIQALPAVAAVKFPRKFIDDLVLQGVCPQGDPGTTRSWNIKNDNPFPVNVCWIVPGAGLSGKLQAAPGNTIFNTGTAQNGIRFRLPNTVMIFWDDNFGFTRLATGAVKNLRCGTPGERSIDNTPSETEPVLLADVYPNPSRDQFRLFLSLPVNSPVLLRVFSAEGRMLLNRQVNDTNSVISINAQSWQPGAYLLNIRQGNFNRTIKLLRQ